MAHWTRTLAATLTLCLPLGWAVWAAVLSFGPEAPQTTRWGQCLANAYGPLAIQAPASLCDRYTPPEGR